MFEHIELKYEVLNNKTALVTGASSGIGMSTALMLAQNGVHLKLSGRRVERLTEMKNFCEKEFKVTVDYVQGDLTEAKTFEEMKQKHFFDADILINNAGLALGRDEVAYAQWDDFEQMIEVNFTAAIKMIHQVLPSMLKKGLGDIVTIGSIAGHQSYPLGSVYCASKAAMTAFHKSLRLETYGKNIRCMLVSPGMVNTEFSQTRFKGDMEKAKAVYQGMSPIKPQDIAAQILHMLKNPRYVNVDDIIVLSTDQGDATTVRRKSP